MATPTPNGKQPPRKPRHRTKPKKHAENSKSGSSSANANANPPRDASVRRGGAGPSLPKGPRSWLAKTQPQNHSDGNSRPTRSSRTSPSARQTPDRLGPSNASTSFAMGGDFIPFDFSEGEDEEGMLPISPVGKGKAPERERVIVDARNGQAGSKRHVEVEFDGDGYINKKQRTDASSRLTPWANDVEWDSCRNLAEMMHKEVEAFVAYISPTPEEHEVRRMIIELITREIQRSWPDARISPFGSYGTKLYLPLGDIDLVIESRAMENHDKKQVLYNLAQILRRAQITDKIQVIAKAKVPIVKFVTNHGRFAVDISLNQANGVKAVRIVNSMLKELPALEPLVMVIKLFLSQRSMNEVYTGGLGSYAIVCMAVSFLQMHPKIRSGEIDPSQNLGVLVIEFFELYGHYFNYDHTGISLRHGGTYFNKRARGWVDFRHPSLLSIEDPLDISNDISKNSFNMSRVRQTLAGAHEVLTAAALMRGRILTSKARGEYTDLRGLRGRAQEHDNQSILSSVMGVTQETLNHRRMIKHLYEQDVLQNLLGLPRHRPAERAANRGTSNTTPPRSRSVRAVESAWGEADMDLGNSEDELIASRVSRSPAGEEESRYSTRNLRKRRRIDTLNANGKQPDTVFVEETDEEEKVLSEATHPSSSASKEILTDGPSNRDARSDKLEARRAYWASKGMPGGGLEDSD